MHTRLMFSSATGWHVKPHLGKGKARDTMMATQSPWRTFVEVYADKSTKEPSRPDRKYTLITGLPLKPYFERITVRRQVDKDMWVFEQPQGFFNVSTVVRMTVIRLRNGDLWVHAPIAATDECITLVKELGDVKHIVLPTTGLEHKIFVKNFAARFPRAKVYACPGQWSWPINLPPPFRVDEYLRDGDPSAPWFGEIEQTLLQPPVIGIGPANEVVFFHVRSKTLLVTDLVQWIDPSSPPEIVPVPDLLDAARELETDPLPIDSRQSRAKGWARMCLTILFLNPPPYSTLALVARRLLVSPVIETFVYSKVPDALASFVDRVTTRWAFTRVIPAHFNAPAPVGPKDLQQAFAFCYELANRTPAATADEKGGGIVESVLRMLQGGKSKLKPAVKYPPEVRTVLDAVNKVIVSSGVASR